MSYGRNMERTRKDALAAAAVTVLADRGSRGLTHRAVDAAAGLKPGAVNYHAPSRTQLLNMALREVFVRDMETATKHFSLDHWTHRAVVDAVVGFVEDMCSEANRARVIARHHLQGESLTHPELRAAFVQLVRDGRAAAGAPPSTAAAELFAMSVDGLLRRQVMIGTQQLGAEDVRAIADVVAMQ